MRRMLVTPYLALACSVLVGACVETDPQMLFDPCVRAATIGMEPNHTKEITCDLKSSTVLVALPTGTPTVTELVDKGLPENVAELVSKNDLAGPRWCFAAIQEALVRVRCVESDTSIEHIFVVRGRRFRLTLSRAVGESVAVVRIRPSEEDEGPKPR